ncbi:MAG: transcriptional regulator [Methanomicrobiaceae archaeon]|nr:transcriptional regulator [Methanomicrobiaceae archaeon]
MEPCCDIMTCEVIARQYIPSVRAELVYRLVKKRGVPQSRVAEWMGLTRAAVSQYLNKKRGSGLGALSDDLDTMLELWAEGVISGDGGITICDVCQCVRACDSDLQFSRQFR